MRRRTAAQSQGFTIVETLVALGILGVVAAGGASIVSWMMDNQTRMSRKFDQGVMLDQVRLLLTDAQLCKPTFGGQIDSEPLQGQSKTLTALKWGSTGEDLVRANDPNSQLKVTQIKVEVANTPPVDFTEADPSSPASPPVALRKYQATLIMSFASNGPNQIALKDARIPFSINRKAADNSFASCYTENSPARICEDELGGSYSASDYPNCLISKMGVGLRYSSGSANLVVGPSGVAHDRNTPSLLEVNGNATVGETLFIGTDRKAFLGRNATGMSLPQDLTLYLNNRPMFRFNEDGFFNAVGGIAFNNGGAASDVLGKIGTATGIFGNIHGGIPDDIGVYMLGQPRMRFDKYGVTNTYSGFAFNHGSDPLGNAGHISSKQYTGFFAFWEPALPNDIGVFIGGNGQFRFHEGGDFIAARDIYASHFQSSSDKRLKDQIHPIEGALDKLDKIKGVEFTWNGKTDRKGEKDIGVIAQDVEKIFPSLVKTDLKGYKTVSYTGLIGPLIQAVKELRDRINEALQSHDQKWEREKKSLEAKLTAQAALVEKQKAELDALKKRLDAIEKRLPK